jgi:thiol:disulfide interchange protein
MRIQKWMLIVLAVLLAVPVGLSAQGKPDLHVKWTYSTKKLSDCEFDLIFTATIDQGWHLYSQLEVPDGPLPTVFMFDPSPDYELIGKTSEPKPIEKPEPVFGDNVVVKYFETKAVFHQKIKVKSDKAIKITGSIDGMACNEGQCVNFFPMPTFTFDVQGKPCGGAVAPTGVIAPTGATAPTGTIISDTAGNGGTSTSAAGSGNCDCANEIKTAVAEAIEGASHKGHPFVDTAGCHTQLIKPTDAELNMSQEDKSFWIIFLLGFLGGLAALVTPCVFPMIPLTVSFFTKRSKDRATGLRNAFSYALSIIFIYVALGMLITVPLGPDALNAMSSSAVFNLIFFFVFIIFAISFLGAFEITIPSRFVNKVDAASDKGGLLGIFFMAFTLSLVSFSCTGPIIGTLLVEAARGGSYMGPAIGMFGFALALALPFALFAMFPGWLNSLPKSGGWLNSVKVTLGFVEIALALKFLSTVDLAYHWDFLKREIFLAVWIVVAIMLGLYLLGKLKLSHDSDLPYISVPRVLLALVCFVFAAYLVPGMWGAPVNFVSGYLPPSHYREWKDPSSGNSECPHDLSCFHDLDEGLCYAKKVGKPVFIDFTGYACVNCRKMEDFVWPQPEIYKYLSEKYVVVSLYVDDKAKLPESQQFTDPTYGKINTVGKKWSMIEAEYYKQNSQPLYVLVDNEGKMLNAPKGYTPAVSEYGDFLKAGLTEYEKRKSEGK